MKDFLIGFFKEGSQESSTRLVMIICAANANVICFSTMAMYFICGKDFSSQAAILSSLLLGIAGGVKVASKGKETTQTKE
jgi:biotin transporter BioY